MGKCLGCVPLLLLFHVTEPATSITNPELVRSSGETVVVNLICNLIYIPPLQEGSNPAWTLSTVCALNTNSQQLFRSFPCISGQVNITSCFSCLLWHLGLIPASRYNYLINNLLNYIRRIWFLVSYIEILGSVGCWTECAWISWFYRSKQIWDVGNKTLKFIRSFLAVGFVPCWDIFIHCSLITDQ